MASAHEAEEIVRRMTRKYGFLDEKMMNDIKQFNAAYRREIDENWLAMENAVSHSVKILAKQIYGSGARFVFELLQNAEDNAFERATARNMLPFITFQIHPNHIVVDCNEDGFTEKDLTAICAVGQSTKSASHGYIGAKGIGFKSVFIAACKVHIHSGNFSFEFRHNKTDPGIGMVRPIWVDPLEIIPNPLTRMTLHLHDEGDEDEIQHLKRVIAMQFNELHETCLLFLRKLRQIKVEFYNEKGELERSKQFRKHEVDEHCVSLETTTVSDGEEVTKSQTYHITRQTATGLAPSDNRELPKSDEGRRMFSTAEVVLAFPLTSDHKPLVTGIKQEIFAFLPLRRSDYKFLIHSDFDTNANRQDIVTTSRRNVNLRGWIATAFFKAVSQFCEHPSLCYDWPMFLPSPGSNVDVFWSGFDHMIHTLMNSTPVLRSRHRNNLRRIGDIFTLASNHVDGDGQPLFDDPSRDLFLSSHYTTLATDILNTYGLKMVSINTLVELLEADLSAANSKMRGKNTTDDWHSKVAQLLSSWVENDSIFVKHSLKLCNLLPLRGGEWTSIGSGPVYFPTIGNIEIPDSLDLRVVCSSASKNPDREALFRRLGVSEATIDGVRASTLNAFASQPDLSFKALKSYLDFLYLTHQSVKHKKEMYAKVPVMTDGWCLKYPSSTDIYLPGTDEEYSPAALLGSQGTAPGLSVPFLHSKSMQDVPHGSSIFHISWENWLCDYVGVRKRLRLLSRTGLVLSDVFLYVFKHRPDKFLGLFENLWLHEKWTLLKNTDAQSQIANLSAKELCGVDFPLTLKETWLPFKPLRDLVTRYMESSEQFPFLKFEEMAMPQQSEPRWDFLTEYFSVGKDSNVDFLLEILRCIQRQFPWIISIGRSQKVFDLYVAIYAKLAVSDNDTTVRCKIRNYFAKQGILDPDGKRSIWTSSSSCLWAAPPDMTSTHSLKIVYSRRLGYEQMTNIENLFERTLEIRDASINDLVTELEALREQGCEDMGRLRGIYEYLDESMIPISDLRAVFEASPIIFNRTSDGKSGWHKLSDCLWSSETEIRGKATLDSTWYDNETFFVGKLGVKLLTLQMVYDELRKSPQFSSEDVKIAIFSLSAFPSKELTSLDPEPIRKAKIFPIEYPNGTVVLGSADVDFAIGDREWLKEKFKGTIALLDFTLKEVCCLKPFFEWAGLQNRYLSESIKERTSISGNLGGAISSRNRNLKHKAYYILRVAATFDSPRFKSDGLELYEQLRTMTVIETDGIISTLEISQNKQLFKADVASAKEHIDDSSNKLTIYVPRERKAQELCFSSVLPRKLMAWLMRHAVTHVQGTVEASAVNALTSIFACDQFVLDEVLDDQGIIQLSWQNENEIEEDVGGSEVEQGQQECESRFEDNSASPGEQITPAHSLVDANTSAFAGLFDARPAESVLETVVETVSQQSNISHRSASAALFHQQSLSPNSARYQAPRYSIPTETEELQYRAILNRVIEKARGARFPPRGVFDMSDMRDALSSDEKNTHEFDSFDGLDVTTRFRSTNQLERVKKIGAAGELYVYELLSQLEMPEWGRANWQSTIRTYVKIHPEYALMNPWTTSETADLVYVDAAGHFTNTLIGCGYLDHDEWHKARPKYYIEVKTTTGPCDTPFYMSSNQYKLMGRIHHTEDHSEVYMIFRVFWVNSDRIGLSVHFDPEQLRQDGRLVFTGQTWSVTPGEGGKGYNE